jgi:hypothetical protein
MGLRASRDMVVKKTISGIAGNRILMAQPLANHSTRFLKGQYFYSSLRIFIGSLRDPSQSYLFLYPSTLK